ncbi:MAG: hypothetical protein COW01_01485 [Bdellovibrionales bacterium CG12_big_fil_rev_8_21_14_0_65_38_15]|nr:MAG: hypothetical protein COW79_00035 [Bdellovibrionales bacterium CG22_combo_CG10-13_8_21_14_all_38_13]PIQ57143.1 MAG: hypothetical protein COW01_01485 [Bdellovibrionales bacterium CG12_big_fil_rev_8_21_14_0_65_38_15]PIR31514.1 MAG: hypothetical protein COV38_00055 [Bdellovibrionales bacterium CG11_big_fil_rev_8_21_14_0_20_38_13]
MKDKLTMSLIAMSLSMPVYPSMFGEETAVLIEIASTTSSQLNELEQLVTNAETYTKKMQEYNELMMDHYWRAERILFVAESLAAKKEAKDLGELNWAIRELKYSMAELKSLMNEYKDIKNEEDRTKFLVKRQKEINEKKGKLAEHQIKASKDAKTTGRATQITAQNTALIYEQNVEMHNTQLEMLEKLSTNNRLKAEELEEKRLEQIEKRKFYGIEKGKR